MSNVTQLLHAIDAGDPKAAGQLLPLVYEELRRLAAQRMAGERDQHTLQPTALVHEAWLRLGGSDAPEFQNRAHFFGAAAEAMRRILIDRARERNTLKRGGNFERVQLEQVDFADDTNDELLLTMNAALDQLTQTDAEAARFIQLRFFAGLTNGEAALVLGVPERTARRHWSFAKAWLCREMQRQAKA